MEIRRVQEPIKQRYREEPDAARLTLVARGMQGDNPMACSIEVSKQIREAQAHLGVGGPGTGACSGDLLLGALAACAQVTAQMVAAAMAIPVRDLAVVVEGDLDLRGTLGVSREAPVGFDEIRLRFDIEAPEASAEQIEALKERTERYCVVMQTLLAPPRIDVQWRSASGLSK